jgi:hypothetical protein
MLNVIENLDLFLSLTVTTGMVEASSNYSDLLKHHLHLRNRLLDQGYTNIRLIRSLKKFIFRYQDLVEIYSVSAETIISDAFSYSEHV